MAIELNNGMNYIIGNKEMKHRAVMIKIPEGLDFSSLELRRDPVTLDTSFNWGPIQTICEVSNIDVALFMDAPEDNISGLIMAWYQNHIENGGVRDEVLEQILEEVVAEDQYGLASVQSAPVVKH